MAAQLAAFLSAAASRGFVWGQHDCMMFAADWALARTGSDPAKSWRGSYVDAAGATAIIVEAGGIRAHMQRTLGPCGWQPVAAAAAREGDIVLARLPRHADPITGIVDRENRVVFVTKRGLLIWPAPIVAAWRHSGLSHG